MRKIIAATALTLAVLAPTAAAADPAFGPGAAQGQGNNEPQDTGARCHPPGQTNDAPNCK